ncbi:MAG TPA: hypothetical protein VKU61_12945, partial [Candidatus Binatia bacterium]|nr:hypothetical protein [Candidatus Binatia bacterium]
PKGGMSYFTMSAALLPVATVAQRVLGPSLELQGYIGAVFGVTGIGLAWLFGRVYRGPLFGVMFAGLLSTSLVELLWSRLGGTYLGGIPHVLAVLVLGFVAGRRNNVFAAILAGALTWLSLYNHYTARACFPLLYVAIAAGAVHRRRPLVAIVVQSAVVTAVMVGAYLWLHDGSLRATLWPTMGGDVGNQGETTFRQLVERNWDASRNRFWKCIDIMFVSGRGGRGGRWGWGLDAGGMLLAPAIVLGGLGVGFGLWGMTRNFLPLAVAGVGLALAVLSEAEARKLVIFDLGWHFLAALGLYGLVHRISGWRQRNAVVLVAAAAYAIAGAWGFAAVTAPARRAGGLDLPFEQFSFPTLGDAFDPPRTLPVAKAWETWMRRGFAVVYVRSDSVAANNQATYGVIAALGAGRPGWFLSLYDLDWGRANAEVRSLSDTFGGEKPFSDAIQGLVRELGARGLVWWFERPTPWDDWLIGQLQAHRAPAWRWPAGADGGRASRATTYVVVENDRLHDTMAALDALDVPRERAGDVCINLEPPTHWHLPTPLVDGAVRVRRTGKPDEWLFPWGSRLYARDRQIPIDERIIGTWSTDAELRVLDARGIETVFRVDEHSVERTGAPLRGLPPGGAPVLSANCATRVGSRWWALDPATGRVVTDGPTDWIPSRPWIGIASDGTDRVFLASADQQIAVLTPATQTVESIFPARVWQWFNPYAVFGSCAALGFVDGYVASFGMNNRLLALYSTDGDEVAVTRLPPLDPSASVARPIVVTVADGLLAFAHAVPAPMITVFPHSVTPRTGECGRGG